jgi:hypothetical protein
MLRSDRGNCHVVVGGNLFQKGQICRPNPKNLDTPNAWCEQFEFEPGLAALGMLRTVARFTWGDYTAISYTWGSLEERKTIIINEVPVTVRRNLAAALDRLRSTHVYKIWVDAICINQDDVNERNSQVMRIRDFFSQSLAVTI